MDKCSIKEAVQKSIDELKNKFTEAYNTEELKDTANEILLNQNKRFNILKVSGTNEQFKVIIESEIKNELELQEFIECYYNAHNNETLRVKKTLTSSLTSRSAYSCRKYYKCKHY